MGTAGMEDMVKLETPHGAHADVPILPNAHSNPSGKGYQRGSSEAGYNPLTCM